jgi:hypothetical protein
LSPPLTATNEKPFSFNFLLSIKTRNPESILWL